MLGATVSDDGSRLYSLVQDGSGAVRLLVCYLAWNADQGRTVVAETAVITPLIRRVYGDSSVEFVPFSGLSSQLHVLWWQQGKLYLVAAVGDEQHLYVSSDGGQTWEE